ncbi:NAD(P)-dependent alcohol dehydrogenase [Leptospira idonii]|uniref:NAD(P)-dependent alcohol dehydrogenase n=1 Tax=Leptospira idonii TaxID=1193500 RepID=A0A4R9LV56_9LEPT|nr:NAD(P)-dependent alcohol dehydrogenase [Leptospira idonii]TGN18050.1 NAD(P)-dependent alcohol dehydrogenase [Leptospira idonii]
MKAITCKNYGSPDVFQLEEIGQPVPKDKEVLIQIYNTAVNSADWRLRKPDPVAARLFFGLFRPRNPVLGGVFSGKVISVGTKVKEFQVGDRVFGSTGMSFGAYAEYKCLNESEVFSQIPTDISYEDAAAIPFGALTAFHFLKQIRIEAGQNVLVYGASGAVGTAAIQIAAAFGAKVTAVCSKANHELVKSIGAESALDYEEYNNGKTKVIYDLIFETVGKSKLKTHLSMLTTKGTLILGSGSLSEILQALWLNLTGKHKILGGIVFESKENLRILSEMMQSGKLKAVIDRTYLLEDMADAHRYVEAGHKKGNVVIEVFRKKNGAGSSLDLMYGTW